MPVALVLLLQSGRTPAKAVVPEAPLLTVVKVLRHPWHPNHRCTTALIDLIFLHFVPSQ